MKHTNDEDDERNQGMDGRANYPQWIESAAGNGPLIACAGHPVEFRAADLLPGASGPGVQWSVDGEVFRGDCLRWIPRSPGGSHVKIRQGNRRATFTLKVGLVPSDLVIQRSQLDYFFCLVSRASGKVHFAPLIGDDPNCG